MGLILFLFACVSFLYAMVGHGGASGYLAVMAITEYPPEFIRTNALILNLLVSAIAFIQFYRGGHFLSRPFFRLIIFSVPFSLIGGLFPLLDMAFRIILSAMLFLAALGIAIRPAEKKKLNELPWFWATITGSIIGLISGLTGIGGGVLLSPVLLLAGWANQKQTAALSAAFIFVNSLSGLSGRLISGAAIDSQVIWMALIVVITAFAGAWLGAGKFKSNSLKWALTAVLFVAAIKLLLEAFR